MKRNHESFFVAMSMLLALFIAVGVLLVPSQGFRSTVYATADEGLDDLAPIGKCLIFHHWQEATCTSPKTCTRCGMTVGEPLGHTYTPWRKTAATCTEPGREERFCIRCNASEIKETKALGHAWGEWTLIEPSDCVNHGSRMHTCTSCGVTKIGTLPLEPHKYSAQWHDEGYCDITDMGLATLHCSVCGLELGHWDYSVLYSGLTESKLADLQVGGYPVQGSFCIPDEDLFIPILSGYKPGSLEVGLAKVMDTDDSDLQFKVETLMARKTNKHIYALVRMKDAIVYVTEVDSAETVEYKIVASRSVSIRDLVELDGENCDLQILMPTDTENVFQAIFLTKTNQYFSKEGDV